MKRDGKTPADWPMADGVITVGRGRYPDAAEIRRFQAAPRVQRALHAQGPRPGPGNSGVYLGGIHELQVLDSYGLKSQNNDCGAIYQQVAPSVNACKPPLQWQTYDVTFHKWQSRRAQCP